MCIECRVCQEHPSWCPTTVKNQGGWANCKRLQFDQSLFTGIGLVPQSSSLLNWANQQTGAGGLHWLSADLICSSWSCFWCRIADLICSSFWSVFSFGNCSALRLEQKQVSRKREKGIHLADFLCLVLFFSLKLTPSNYYKC